MIGLRPLLMRTAAASGTEEALEDVSRFWACVEWNAYLRRGTMLAVCVGGEAMEPTGAPRLAFTRTEIASMPEPTAGDNPRYIYRVYGCGNHPPELRALFNKNLRVSLKQTNEATSQSVLNYPHSSPV